MRSSLSAAPRLVRHPCRRSHCRQGGRKALGSKLTPLPTWREYTPIAAQESSRRRRAPVSRVEGIIWEARSAPSGGQAAYQFDSAHGQRRGIPGPSPAYQTVLAVPPTYTSQRCSGCGVVGYKGLSDRRHRCTECGTSLHRDHNAAKKRERLGQSLQGGVAIAASEN
jgi:hypothetical protein